MTVPSTIKKYRKFQVGTETVAGTEVAATRVIRALNVNWNDAGSWRKYVPMYDIGRMSLDPDVGEITRQGLLGKVETDLTFEDFLLPLLHGYKGAVTPVEQNVGEGDWLWTFKNAPTLADPAPDTFTAEFRMSNGTANYDRTTSFCVVSSIEISADQGGDASKLTYDFFGRTANGNAITGALTLPTPFDLIAALDWKLYVDPSWATLGTTQISTAMRSFTWRYNTGIMPALFIGDGRLDHADIRVQPRGAELSMEWEFGASADAERTAFEANSLRFIRFEAEGAQIGAGDNKRITIDGAYQYGDGGFGELGREADGNDTVPLTLRTVAESDTNDLSVAVLNSLATFPA